LKRGDAGKNTGRDRTAIDYEYEFLKKSKTIKFKV
jgi:hypothetical protein